MERQRDDPMAKKSISMQAWVPRGDHTIIEHSPTGSTHGLRFLDLLDLIQLQVPIGIVGFGKGKRQRETRGERAQRKLNSKETLAERKGWTL